MDPDTLLLADAGVHVTGAWFVNNFHAGVFTDGVDPEYTEQILPIVVEWTAGHPLVLEVGTGEGQVARAVAEVNRATVVGVDPMPMRITSRLEIRDSSYSV